MRIRQKVGSLCWLIALAMNGPAIFAAEFHVAPSGSPDGDGSTNRPWDLATAFAPPGGIAPGDTIWLHGGTYRGGFESRLTGRADAPIVVRGVQTERVTIDTNPRDDKDNALLLLFGADTIYRDFEVTCSHPTRETKIPGSWPEDIRRGSVDVRGSRLVLANLVVHDLVSGFGFWAAGEGGEITGSLIYNNGWRGPERGHGHGIYAQNEHGTKRIADNIIFHQFAYGIHVYGSEKASLKGFEIEGNIVFENGCLTGPGEQAPAILVGGGSAAERIIIRDNVAVGGGVRLGYTWGTTNEDVLCTGNYFLSGLSLRDFRQATIMHNTIVAPSSVVVLEGAERIMLGGLTWNENKYYLTDGRWGECAIIEGSKSRGMTFDEWQSETGLDAASTFTKGAPSELRVIVRPNQYEPGRANIAVINPASLDEVEVDLSNVLTPGQAFRIVSAKDFYGPALVVGTYDGSAVRVPMKPVIPPAPVGMPDAETPQTEPQFAAFVVRGASQ